MITKMGALAKIKESELAKIVGATVGEAFNAFVGMVNSQEEEDLDKVIAFAKKKTNNPEEVEELEKFKKIADLTDQDLNERADKQFTIREPEKDEDGYNKIPDRLGDIEADVSEEDAKIKLEQQRQKGGKQKTRVDED